MKKRALFLTLFCFVFVSKADMSSCTNTIYIGNGATNLVVEMTNGFVNVTGPSGDQVRQWVKDGTICKGDRS